MPSPEPSKLNRWGGIHNLTSGLRQRIFVPLESSQRQNIVRIETIDFQAEQFIERRKAGIHDSDSQRIASVNLTALSIESARRLFGNGEIFLCENNLRCFLRFMESL